MVRLAISVEGQTEEIFCERTLCSHLNVNGIFATPILLNGRGGDVRLNSIGRELDDLARGFDFVTTLYDFYGFKGKTVGETKDSLEAKMVSKVSPGLQNKVIPYVQMYEFEGLLFSSPDAMASQIEKRDRGDVSHWAEEIVRRSNDNPEAINDSPQTAPSKRLQTYTSYKKTIDGPNIMQNLGLSEVRVRCEGFNNWISRLEVLNAYNA